MKDAHGIEMYVGDIISYIRPKNRDLELGKISRFTAEKVVMTIPYMANGKQKYVHTYLDAGVCARMEPTQELLDKVNKRNYI